MRAGAGSRESRRGFGAGAAGAATARVATARAATARAATARHLLDGARGQATVETIALAPVIVAVGLAVLQLLAVGYASVHAGNAAEAGALALAAGADAREGAERSLPGWSRARARVDIEGGRVEVHLRPPSPLEALADRLEVSAAATVEAP